MNGRRKYGIEELRGRPYHVRNRKSPFWKAYIAMVLTCSVVGCTNRGNTNSKGEKVSYHRFPVVIESQGEKT